MPETDDSWDYEHGDVDFYEALLEKGPPPGRNGRARHVWEWQGSIRLGLYPLGIIAQIVPD